MNSARSSLPAVPENEPENLRITCEIEPEPPLLRARVHALHLIDRDQVGRFFIIREGEELTAGRQVGVGMELSDQGVSRIHATFTVRGDAAFVRDAGSRNGTYVNGTRIARPVRLTPGDVVALGAVRMRYSLDSEEELARLNQLRDAALRDHLTGTYNRRHFEERLASELAYAVRHGTTLALLLLDLDCFKRINDEHGHPAGDAVLRAFAQMLLKNVRTEDVVARWGGEEFVVLARGTDGRGGVILGERLRRGALQLRIPVNGVELCISTSIGVSAVTPGVTGVNALQLLRLADLALYEAKHAGRNRVVDVDSLPSAKLTPIDKSTRRR